MTAPPAIISGYAATFAVDTSQPHPTADAPPAAADAQGDLIQPGAFLASLARRAGRLPLLWQHDLAEPIGRIRAVHEDERGLWFQAELATSRRAVDALALLRTGALRECSIGFLPGRVRFRAERRAQPHATLRRSARRVRLLDELELIEISLVTLAANPNARLLTLDGAPLNNSPPSP